MKRKLIYTIIFISIFLMSSASMVTPVQGYEPPDIPSEAKGMTLDDAEVTVHDEDGLEDSLGKGFDIKDIKNGDPDIVGARSQYKIIDWETDEDLIDYEEVWVYEAVGFETSAVDIRTTFWNLAGTVPSLAVPPLASIFEQISPAAQDTGGVLTTIATAFNASCAASLLPWADILNLYSQSYDGTILEREVWDYLDPAEEFDANKPDTDDDEVPFMLDPRDWRTSWDNVAGLRDYILGTALSIQSDLDDWYGYLAFSLPASNWTAINGTLAGIAGLNDTLISIVSDDMPLAAYILGSYIIQNVKYLTEYSVPTKAGYLLQLLEAGQPCCGPADDFIKRAVKEFRINKGPWRIPWIAYGEDFVGLLGAPVPDLAISAIPVNTIYFSPWTPLINFSMGGETVYVNAEVEIDVDDAGIVTFNFEYADNQQDPKDILRNNAVYRYVHGTALETDPDELDDWEMVFPKASDAPTQIKDGDTILWESTPMEGPIPGYETPVILGVALVSVIGLIYVVMRKRKK